MESSTAMDAVIIQSSVTLLITFLNVVFTYAQRKRDYKTELNNHKLLIQFDKMSELAMETMELLNNARKSNSSHLEKIIIKMRKLIYTYGSLETIRIYSLICEEHFIHLANKDENVKDSILIYLYPLLLSQIKFDATGEYVSPDYWYKMTITDYQEIRDSLKNHNNSLIRRLNLNRKFMM